jgi:hypothetical protein
MVTFESPLWRWDARRSDSWMFVSLPAEASDEIRDRASEPRRGFGSVKVRATVGGSSWLTSIFPGEGGGPYVLPVKRAVRTVEGLDVGDTVTVTVDVLPS